MNTRKTPRFAQHNKPPQPTTNPNQTSQTNQRQRTTTTTNKPNDIQYRQATTQHHQQKRQRGTTIVFQIRKRGKEKKSRRKYNTVKGFFLNEKIIEFICRRSTTHTHKQQNIVPVWPSPTRQQSPKTTGNTGNQKNKRF